MRQAQNDKREKDKEGTMPKRAKISTALPSHRAPHHPSSNPQIQPLF